MKTDIWIEKKEKIKLQNPIAIVGSPGLGSIGKLVVEKFIEETKAQRVAKLYSTHLPMQYQTKPAYLAHYALPGIGGIKVDKSEIDLPKVEFFINKPSLILVNGYHANFEGAYEIAKKVVEILKELAFVLIDTQVFPVPENRSKAALDLPGNLQESGAPVTHPITRRGPVFRPPPHE